MIAAFDIACLPPHAMRPALLSLLLSLACTACAPPWVRRPPETPPENRQAVQVVEPVSAWELLGFGRRTPTQAPAPRAAAAHGADETGARQRVAQAVTFVEQTRVLLPTWTEAESLLHAAREALAAGDWITASTQAVEASARTDAALSDHYATLAAEELHRAYQFVGLDDAQLLQLHAAEETLVAGNGRLAYGRLRQLNRQITQRLKTYTVRAGDSLWVIAGRREGYANPWLWPLIWQANVAVLPNPARLLKGQVLKLRPHPTADEVAIAIRQARREAGVLPTIGRVRPLVP